MLKAPAPYPEVGSYALLIDDNLPVSRQRAELVRIHRRNTLTAAVSFPLRTGASGNRVVAVGDLLDGTPLTKDEERRMHDLQRAAIGSERVARAKAAEAEALKSRLMYSQILGRELNRLGAIEAFEQNARNAAGHRRATVLGHAA